jgi:hypothetical protein
MSDASVLRWLMDGDPAIRWQVLADLTDAPPDAITTERSRVAREGWGEALLDRQAPQGWWDDGDDPGWMIAMDALALLREMGLDPHSDEALRAISRVKTNLTWETLGDRPYFDGETEPCINGAILAFGSYFGERCDRIVDRLLSEQLVDGGWNCDAPPSVRSSFNSTIRVLEGLLEHERRWGSDTMVADARRKGEEYLLERRSSGGSATVKSSTSAGRVSPSRRCGTTTSCAASIIYEAPASAPTNARRKRSKSCKHDAIKTAAGQ